MPERVGLELRAKALGVDVGAVLLVAFLFGPWLGIRLGLGQVGGQGLGAGGMMAGAVGGSTLMLLVYFASEAVWDATPGKRLFGLCLRDADGAPLSPGVRVARWALKNAGAWLLLVSVVVSVALPGLGGMLETLAQAVGLLLAGGALLMLRPPRQGLHDRLLGTAVFRRADLPEESSDSAED